MTTRSIRRDLSAVLLSGTVLGLLAARPNAQNLVPNPSFEKYLSCPTTIGQMTKAVSWAPANGTPDYHNACASLIVDVPNNTWGSQAARTGSAYASCIVYHPKSFSGEYIQAKLTSPLIAGKSYQVTFFVSLCDKSYYGIAELGAYLSKGAVSPSGGLPLPYTPQIENSSSNIIVDKKNWTKITGTMVAKGGESHIVIGNFNKGPATTIKATDTGTKWANYYIDDVSVVPTTSGGTSPVPGVPHVVGWAELPAVASGPGVIEFQRVERRVPCTTAQRCQTALFKKAWASFAGGTAYDPRSQTIWISDGGYLGQYHLDGTGECRGACKRSVAFITDQKKFVSGLAHAENTPRLFALATSVGQAEIAVYDTATKCPNNPKVCKIKLPDGALAGGLAYSETDDRLFISVSTPLKLGGFSHEVWQTTGAKPCTLVCKTALPHCKPAFVTGLAYDCCKGALYATDGRYTSVSYLAAASLCTWRMSACCLKASKNVYRGIALAPGWTKKDFGKPCSGKFCPTCPSIQTKVIGDPVPGSTFLMSLENAPPGGSAILFGKLGSCGPAVTPGAPFCGPWYALPAGFILPPVPLSGSGSCCGSSKVSAKIPPLKLLCGVKFCFQWVFSCKGPGPVGFGASTAFEFTITGG